MQTGLERRDPDNAILITSLVFVLSHITHGLGAVLLLGPGMFAASVLYGMLARRTGTIVPGMVIHVVGDQVNAYGTVATIVCVDTEAMAAEAAGRTFDASFVGRCPRLSTRAASEVSSTHLCRSDPVSTHL